MHILTEYKAAVESEPKLIPPVHGELPMAQVTVENIQPDLKWLVFTINWDELVLNPENQTPTDMIPLEVASIDGRTGLAKRDGDGNIMTETLKVAVYDPHTDEPYVITPVDGCPDLPETCPTRAYFENGEVMFPATIVRGGRAVETEVPLALSDSLPNLKRSVQETKLALHRLSDY
jgi:hypothetical protein